MVNRLYYDRAFKVRLTLKGAFSLQNTEQAFALVIHMLVWAEAEHMEATASYSNTIWQDVILPRDTSIEVNKTAPTAEGTLWSHSTTLLLFMSSPESDAQSVCLAGANCCGDSSLWREANWKTNLWASANRLRVLRIGKEFLSCRITCASTQSDCLR